MYIQTCSEMVMPIGIEGNNTMFQPDPFNFKRFAKECKKSFGVSPRPHWVTTYYGGHVSTLFSSQFTLLHSYILIISQIIFYYYIVNQKSVQH